MTVAALPEPPDEAFRIDGRDLEVAFCRGSGPGGQHRNMTASAVQIHHIPSGIRVRAESERSQHRNRETAMAILRTRLAAAAKEAADAGRAGDRKRQVGSGMRGDKRRTVRMQDGAVKDHVTGASWRIKEYLAGDW